MPIPIKTPDGNIAQFPDGMSDQQISAVLAKEFPAPKAAPVKPQPNTYADVIKSAAQGTLEGASAVAGLPGDISRAVNWGMRKIGIPTRDPDQPLPDTVTLPGGELGLGANPDTAQVRASVPVPEYKSQTIPGEYTRTIFSFLPAAALPGSMARRVANVVLPAVASETAGQATKGSDLEPYARAAGAVAGGITPSIASMGVRMANKGAEALTGSGFLNPNVEAANRLSNAFAADGGLDRALDRNASFTNSGASAPTVLDLGGGNVHRLVRAAAGGGDEAHNVATTYADRVRANLQDNVIDRAGQLTPGDARTAGQAATALETGQRDLARVDYGAVRNEPVALTREALVALRGKPGQDAIAKALSEAEIHHDVETVSELQNLQHADLDQIPTVRAGTLDALQRTMGNIGADLSTTPGGRYAGSGYYGRKAGINSALDAVPGLQPARSNFGQMQASRNAVDVGATVLSSPSANYADQISGLASVGGPPNLRPLQIGARQAITDAVEAPAAGQTGVLTKLATGNRATANLANTFGADRAASFQDAVRNEVSRLRNANFISPETGSQTQLRGADEALVGGIPTSIGSFVSKIADKIFRGTQLTAAEREAIVRLGTSEADVRRFATQNTSPVARAALPVALANSSRAQQQ